MATKKKVEPEKLKPVKKASSEKPPKKDKLLEAVVDVAVAETPKKKDGTRVHETIADVMEEYNDLKAEADAGLIEPDCDKTVTAAAENVLADLEQDLKNDPSLQVQSFIQQVDRTQLDSPFVEPDSDGMVMGLPVVAEIPETSSGLLAHFPNGETREPTKEELVEMGRAIAERLFGNRNVQAEPVAKPDAPPKPKISGNHCRLCKSFAGNDPRGALWSDSGMCLTYNHVQMPVEPEHYCNRFVFDEALRDAEPR
jgi:hypothetical protein